MERRKVSVVEKETKLQMTSMIDVVFLLLAFFVVTYKSPEVEGDFNIRMPANAQSNAVPDLDDVSPVVVRLKSDDSGKLSAIFFGEKLLSDMKELRAVTYRYAVQNDVNYQEALSGGSPSFRDDVEIELDCDPQLHYENAVEAMTSVTGYVNADDQIVKMVEKVKFSPLKK